MRALRSMFEAKKDRAIDEPTDLIGAVDGLP